MEAFTVGVFEELLNRPGVDLDVRPFYRATRIFEDGTERKVQICPHSFPSPVWVNLLVEQIITDTSGMQPRYWHNDLPWLMQPAIYCDAFLVVSQAGRVVREFLDEQEKHKGDAHGRAGAPKPRDRTPRPPTDPGGGGGHDR